MLRYVANLQDLVPSVEPAVDCRRPSRFDSGHEDARVAAHVRVVRAASDVETQACGETAKQAETVIQPLSKRGLCLCSTTSVFMKAKRVSIGSNAPVDNRA